MKKLGYTQKISRLSLYGKTLDTVELNDFKIEPLSMDNVTDRLARLIGQFALMDKEAADLFL